MSQREIDNDKIRLIVVDGGEGQKNRYWISSIDLRVGNSWQTIAGNSPTGMFRISNTAWGADHCVIENQDDGSCIIIFSGQSKDCMAEMVVTVDKNQPIIHRHHRYTFLNDIKTAICPGWKAVNAEALKYTYPIHVYEQPLTLVTDKCADVAWAMPLPFQIWNDGTWVAALGIDRAQTGGTVALNHAGDDIWFNSYLPDTATEHPADFGCVVSSPGLKHWSAGETVELADVLWAKPLESGQYPVFEAVKAATEILSVYDTKPVNLKEVADRIVDYYHHCELWTPDALGPGRGWFKNMWVFTQKGEPSNTTFAGYYDFGWGEGVAPEMMVGAVRHWQRTGDNSLLSYVDEMTRNIPLFSRGPGDDEPFFDRSNGKTYNDFMIDYFASKNERRIWTHSLGHSGSQLMSLYLSTPDYPKPETRDMWLSVARQIGRFFAKIQKEDGDLSDIVDDNNIEVNKKPHRVSARLVVAGLWVQLSIVDKDSDFLNRAHKLVDKIGGEIDRYEFYNQMIDSLSLPDIEFTDGEAGYYALEGLVPLYEQTQDARVLELCKKCVAWGVSWTYFFDLPHAPNGVAKGGQCCRMFDYPLLYPIGPAKAVELLCRLSDATGDTFYRHIAEVMVKFIGHCSIDAPGKPWDGGIIHAIEQWTGKHWGPDKSGQVDSGMATGNSLAAIEYWLSHQD